MGTLDTGDIKGSSQVVPSITQNVSGLWRWTDTSVKGYPLAPVIGKMAVHLVLVCLSFLGYGMGYPLQMSTELM